MLEWYEIGKTYQDLMLSTQNFIKNFLDIEFTTLNLPQNLPNNEPDFNQYFLNEIEPNLPKDKAIFITGYPAFLSPLAATSDSELNNFSAHSECEGMSPKVASTAKIGLTSDRFELYINGLEIANACTENTNSDSILKAFNSEKAYRIKNNLPLHPIDNSFATNSVKLGLTSGIGLGIDRLLKIINNYAKFSR
jgi:lysyl-tRNA synthetase class 2